MGYKVNGNAKFALECGFQLTKAGFLIRFKLNSAEGQAICG